MQKKNATISKRELSDRAGPSQNGRQLGRGFLILAWILILGSLPAYSQGKVRQLFDVRIPMRDGVETSADIWLPLEEGSYPVILMRTPYLKTRALLENPQFGRYFAGRGYVWAVQDVRGRGDSDGEYGFYAADRLDGYDTIEWLARQPWSNGKVGMMGVSYLGAVQWLAAREKPPHLRCIVSTAPGGFNANHNWQNGALLMEWALTWTNTVMGRILQGPNAAGIDWDRVYAHRPLLTMDEAMGRKMWLYRDFVQYPDHDPYWKDIHFGPETFEQIDIPALHVAGWFDGDQPSGMYNWRGMREHSPARDKQHLLLGPWTHRQTFLGGGTSLGEMEFSGDSIVDNKALHLEFFDHYLRGNADRFDFPRARIYVMGDNRWRDFDEYPPSQAQFRKIFLHSGGRANSLLGDGSLNWTPPGDEPTDGFTYDPQHPVPGYLGEESLPLDQRPIEVRDDVLVYTSEVLTERVEFIGNPKLVLYAASDAKDTDFTAKLIDVYPDQRAVRLGTLPCGVVRARFRNGYGEPQFLEAGKVEKYEIPLWDLAHTFLPGHRIRIEVSSSAYPFVAPNQNTGNPIATDTEWKVAHQTIHHDQRYPTHLLLPVMPDE